MRLPALALAALLLVPSVVDASDDRPRYWPQVREARQWLKTQMPYHQWRCLHHLWENESSWRVKARNRYSGAYGIPQALPPKKMASAGSDWRTSAMTQVKWGRRYIRARYGFGSGHGPCRALAFQDRNGWY